MNLYDADRAAHMLVSHHLAGQGWRIQWGNSRSAAGRCKYREKVLQFSSPITALVSNEEFIDTVLHEIAHALTPGAKHSNVWKSKYREIGGTGDRTWSDAEVQAAVAKWVIKCSMCDVKIYRNRVTQSLRNPGAHHTRCGKSSRLTILPNR